MPAVTLEFTVLNENSAVQVTSAGDGQLALPLARGAHVTIGCTTPGWAVVEPSAAFAVEEPLLIVVASTGTLVCRASGDNAADGLVGVSLLGQFEPPRSWSAFTAGEAELQLPPGSYWIWLRASAACLPQPLLSGVADALTVSVVAGAATHVKLPEVFAAKLELQFLDSVSEEPVPDARVRMQPEGTYALAWSTDVNGRCALCLTQRVEVEVLSEDDEESVQMAGAWLTVEKPGYVTGQVPLLLVPDPRQPRTIPLARVGSGARLTVELGSFAEAGLQAEVRALDRSGLATGWSSTADAQNELIEFELGAGFYGVTVAGLCAGAAELELLVPVRRPDDVIVLALDELLERLRVDLDRAPPAVGSLQIPFETTRTRQGVIVRGSLAPGSSTLVPIPTDSATRGQRGASLNVGGRLGPGLYLWPIAFDLAAGHDDTLHVPLLGPAVRFDARPGVSFGLQRGALPVSLRTDAAGRALVLGIATGNYRLWPALSTEQLISANPLDTRSLDFSSNQLAGTSADHPLVIEFDPTPAKGSIVGSLVRRLPGLRYAVELVRLDSDLAQASPPHFSFVDAQGQFVFADLGPGPYRLWVSHENEPGNLAVVRGSQQLDVTVGNGPLQVQLSAGP